MVAPSSRLKDGSMITKNRYPIANALRFTATFLDVPPERLLRRAGLPVDLLQNEGKGVTGAQFVAVWQAAEAEAPAIETTIGLAQALARRPFAPALFAFSCSPDIATGIERLAVFTPLVAPFRLTFGWSAGTFQLSLAPSEPDIQATPRMSVFEMVYILECCRNYTGERIVPVEVGLKGPVEHHSQLEAHFGVRPAGRPVSTLVLRDEDTRRRLLTENPALWAGFEADLTHQLALRKADNPMAAPVRAALTELLPSGRATANHVCGHLRLSKRSLQRHLQVEGQSFQKVLEDTRRDLALHYLRQDGVSVEEISFLLAYRDPNSFYRAFHSWTDETPSQARRAAPVDAV